MTMWTVTSRSPDETTAWGRRTGLLCRGGETIFLQGDLGAGKTRFAQGLADGLGIPASVPVTSPTFTLHAEYAGRLRFQHLDLYRLETPTEALGLGFDELLGRGDGVAAVEWPECLSPEERPGLRISIAHGGEDASDTVRCLTWVADDARHAALLEALRRLWTFTSALGEGLKRHKPTKDASNTL